MARGLRRGQNEFVKGHAFVALHAAALPELLASMAAPDLPRGVLHGDPFLDNMLASEDGRDVYLVRRSPTIHMQPRQPEVSVRAQAKRLARQVDWEDVCVGPLIFDVACAIIGCCYRSQEGEDNGLDFSRLRPLLAAYHRARPLAAAELRLLLPFMRLTLLCNATWRFRNFNVVRPRADLLYEVHRSHAWKVHRNHRNGVP
jgi:Ser/Thr protein kinase RdoA (MazF antagonist)